VQFLRKFFFVRRTALPSQGFEVIHHIFEISMTLRARLPDAFQHLVPNDNFHCQTPLKNVKFDLFGSEKYKLSNLVANTDWLIVTVLQTTRHAFFGNSKQLQRHDSVRLSSVYTDYSSSGCISSHI